MPDDERLERGDVLIGPGDKIHILDHEEDRITFKDVRRNQRHTLTQEEFDEYKYKKSLERFKPSGKGPGKKPEGTGSRFFGPV